MPNTLPVPSKAALRTLRNLALGTSCTVAFTTGLLTEDRRRRIHAAREVHTNAKKLKSSRKYHSVGSPSADTFEEQVMRYRDDGFWQGFDTPATIEPAQALPLEHKIPELAAPHQKLHYPFQIWRPEKLHPDAPRRLDPFPATPSGPQLTKIPCNPHKLDKIVHRRQEKLARDVIRLLQGSEGSDVEASAKRFFDAFDEGLPIDDSGLRKELTKAAIQLSKACLLEHKLEVCHKILDVVLANGPIDEKTFFSLNVEMIINDLVDGPVDKATGKVTVDDSKLQKAAALYLTKFREKPGIASRTWLELGVRLCRTTCRRELFRLTEALYWRVEVCRGDVSNVCMYQLISALYKQGCYKKFLNIFKRLLVNAPLSDGEFFKIGEMAVEVTLKIQRLDIAEEALVILAKVGKGCHVRCYSRWFSKVLRSDWGNHGDITRTQELFERLVPHLPFVNYPQAVYGAIIQFCVEARDEIAAQSYYDRLQQAHGPLDAYGVRILGHFAYAKAMRNDWTGVKEDFREMWQLEPGTSPEKTTFKEDYSASFAPVFTLFAKTHSVNETEEFLRAFIDHLHVNLKPYMSTTMITKYSETHEIDSISRWLDYMISVGSPPDPMFFNAIIGNCHTKWKFSFEELHQLYREVREVAGSASNFVNNDTFTILRRIAMAEAGQDIPSAATHLERLNLDQPLRYPVDSCTVQQAMDLALTRDSPRNALRIYKRAQQNHIPLDAACLTTVVKASLQDLPSNIHAAASLLRKPQTDGLDVSDAIATIFVHQITYQYSTAKQCRVQDIARNTVAFLEEQGIAIRLKMITHTMHTLVNQGRHYQATEFWDSMSRRGNTLASLDLPTLTVLLRAYIGVQDCVGVEWAIQMLSTNDLSPDKIFRRVLRNALSELRNCKGLGPAPLGPSGRQLYKVLQNSLRTVVAMRSDARDDRDDFKIKTLKIMEKAIEYQKTTELGAGVEWSNSQVRNDGKNPTASSTPNEGCLGASEWMESDDEHVDMPVVGRLVGVNAG